jgi:hypothetical protein
MGKGEVLGCSALGEDYGVKRTCGYLKPCVPPPWLGSSQIPSAGDHVFNVFFEDVCLVHETGVNVFR